MANLNTGASIVDLLKSTGKKSDFGSRSQLATEYGIKNYTGTADQNTQLLGFVSKSSKPPANLDQANERINESQENDFNTKTKEKEPPKRNSSKTYDDIYSEITSSLTKSLPKKPETIDLANEFVNLRKSQGIVDLETSLTDLQSQARDIQAISRARTTAEKGKAVPMNVIAGRVSEEEAQDNERLQVVNDSIKTISSQLETKYNVIDNIMKYKGTDYANSVDAYDKAFSQNLSLMTQARGIAEDERTKEETTNDNARANLQIIYNNLSSGGVDPDSIDPAQKANITKLELQAGLPVGFYSNVVNKNPKADILSTTTREDGGKKYADVITRGADGKISTQSIYLGGSANEGGSGKVTEADQRRTAVSSMAKDLSAVSGSDGYVAPNDYKQARQEWIKVSGYTGKEFDEAFKNYVNPTQYGEVGFKLEF